ncbi:MAG: MBOAT family protein [Desulfovibrio sp.]|nr:MBOAT family protein [Desulfovibrio sp.]MBI4958626.1 MBOAT family protein [Desulfovibrio sp.]
MVFSSASFLFYFLPLVLLLYYVAAPTLGLRNLVLLVASFIFYAWGEGIYTVVMAISIMANYFFGLWVHRAHENSSAKLQIGLAIAFNITLLVIFKYTNFIVDNLNLYVADPLGLARMEIGKIHLPIGVSFFTFHCISYLMDIYRKQTPPNTSLPQLSLYIALFPQLVAGPIIRYKDIADQLSKRTVGVERFAYGVNRFVSGLGKKVLIANVVALPADKIFSIPSDQLTTPVAWLGVICYTLQIYFDFSGYSDMAIGLGHMFGFKFMENFNYPYISRSIREFWRRWHISLSTWYRDYLYIPLGGNRCSNARVTFNLILVFFLCGLWHGASWSFIVWGLYHGAFLGLERTRFGKWIDTTWRPVSHVYTILVFMVGWVFFRAESLGQAEAFLKAMAGISLGSGKEWHVNLFLNPKVIMMLGLGVIGSLPIIPWIRDWRHRQLERSPSLAVGPGIDALVGLVATPIILILSCMSLASGTHNPFIYFQF